MSQRASQVIAESQVIIGYKTYIKLLDNLSAGKEVICSGMTKEIDRAIQAIEKASSGKKVCLISSGDPGIYGMAGVILELLKKEDAKKIKLEIIPGITAASSCASLLGAPLAQDFSVISLSDLLVNRKMIEKKIKAALNGGFVIVLYNPKSRSRIQPLDMAWNFITKNRPPATPVGIVKNAYRAQEDIRLMPLKEAVLLKDIDMATTIIVGNSETFIKDNRYMITKRGYKIKK